MVLAFIEFVNRFATFEVVSAQDSGLFKLGQHPINSGKPYVGVFVEQMAKYIFRGHVTHRAALKNFQDFQSGQCGFQAVVFKFVDLAHGVLRVGQEQRLKCEAAGTMPDHIGMPSTMTAFLTFRFPGPWLVALLLGASLAGCGSFSDGLGRDTFKPYVPEVVQGNFVSNEQRQALRPGMPRAQVRDILGTPLIASLFHEQRWDYAFSIQRQGVAPQSFRLTVYFKGDVLDQVESDVLPSEAEFAGRLVRSKSVGKLPMLQASEEELKKFAPPTPNAQPSVSVPAASLPRQYPPLEPASP